MNLKVLISIDNNSILVVQLIGETIDEFNTRVKTAILNIF